MVRRILLLTFLLCSRVAVCQMYAWNPAPFKLNRSGLRVESKATQFQFLDWNGDFDLAADSSRFWWNTGSNLNPIWLQDDSLLAGILFVCRSMSMHNADLLSLCRMRTIFTGNINYIYSSPGNQVREPLA